MIMHSADFSATSIGRTPLFDHVTLSAKRGEQTLVLPGAKSGLSRIATIQRFGQLILPRLIDFDRHNLLSRGGP